MKTIYPFFLVALLSVILLAEPAQGTSDWEEFNTYRGNVYLYNKADIKRSSDNVVQAWIRTVYSSEGRQRHIQHMSRQQPGVAKGWDGLMDRLSLVEVECPQSRFRVLYFAYYDLDGRILQSQSPDERDWRSIVPESPLDVLKANVCK